MQRAEYWILGEGGQVQCTLCPHRCVIPEGRTGKCRVRGVRNGELIALGYGRLSSAHIDPIEKKPLYHFYPGQSIFSAGGWGCNLGCTFCQNCTISQTGAPEAEVQAPAAVVAAAAGTLGIAYTYNEPTVGFEYVRDMAQLAREEGFKNVLVTNGHFNAEPAAELLPLMDALNIDIKSMDASFYREQCGGDVAAVLALAAQAVAAGCHVELTNLLIPGLNDSDGQIEVLARWVVSELGVTVPLHLSGYHPAFKMTRSATPVRTLERAWELCRERLEYVYLGNLRSTVGQDTACPGCHAVLIRRDGYKVAQIGLASGRCQACGRVADMILA
ncbi:MAG: AmmeMemoRadiSam system radical SAM enzyme [Lentisphaerae bacterium]|nr:AmmeMemoRadiSam system radical SAM enzyme [Lentisphaerota bacterium]